MLAEAKIYSALQRINIINTIKFNMTFTRLAMILNETICSSFFNAAGVSVVMQKQNVSSNFIEVHVI